MCDFYFQFVLLCVPLCCRTCRKAGLAAVGQVTAGGQIHAEHRVSRLAQRENALAFLLPKISKEAFFRGIVMDGVLPRKTFSMGHAQEKRYYIECRRITEE